MGDRSETSGDCTMSDFNKIRKISLNQKIQELQSALLKPLTKENIFYHYLPLFGVKSYLELSLNIFNPNLSAHIYRRIGFPDLTTTNTVSAAACLGLYLYNRQTMAGTGLHIRAGYSFYHSTIFVLGSVLAWATVARHLTSSAPVKCLIALGISTGMLRLAYSSLNHIDGRLGKTLGWK